MNLSELSERAKSISILILGITLIIIILTILYHKDQLELSDAIGIVGSIASVIGILIAYLQITSVRKITNETNKAVNNAFSEFFKMFSISDVTRAAKLSQEIESFLRSEKPEAALLRLQDLKSLMIQIKHIETFEGLYDIEEFDRVNVSLVVDIGNLNSLLLKKKPSVNYTIICNNLESISTLLNELENKLKYNRHGSKDNSVD